MSRRIKNEQGEENFKKVIVLPPQLSKDNLLAITDYPLFFQEGLAGLGIAIALK